MKFCRRCNSTFPDDEGMFCPKCSSILINAELKNDDVKPSSKGTKKSKRIVDPTLDPGVFKLVNKRTGEVFVAHSNNVTKKIKQHLNDLEKNRHRNEDLQADYNNGDRFRAERLEEFDYYDKKELHQYANKWIEKEDSFNHGYNRAPKVGYNPYEKTANPDVGGRLKNR